MSLKPKKSITTKQYLSQVSVAAIKAGLHVMSPGTLQKALLGKKKHYRLHSKKKGSDRLGFPSGFSKF